MFSFFATTFYNNGVIKPFIGQFCSRKWIFYLLQIYIYKEPINLVITPIIGIF